MPSPYSIALLKNIGLCTEKSEIKRTYSSQPPGKINLARLTENKADFFEKMSIKSRYEFKKIILTDETLACNPEDPELTFTDPAKSQVTSYSIIWSLFQELRKSGCEIYLWQNNALEEVKNISQFNIAVKKINSASPEHIQKVALEKFSITSKEIFLMDYFKRIKVSALLLHELDSTRITRLLPNDYTLYVADFTKMDGTSLQRFLMNHQSTPIKVLNFATTSELEQEIAREVVKQHPEIDFIQLQTPVDPPSNVRWLSKIESFLPMAKLIPLQPSSVNTTSTIDTKIVNNSSAENISTIVQSFKDIDLHKYIHRSHPAASLANKFHTLCDKGEPSSWIRSLLVPNSLQLLEIRIIESLIATFESIKPQQLHSLLSKNISVKILRLYILVENFNLLAPDNASAANSKLEQLFLTIKHTRPTLYAVQDFNFFFHLLNDHLNTFYLTFTMGILSESFLQELDVMLSKLPRLRSLHIEGKVITDKKSWQLMPYLKQKFSEECFKLEIELPLFPSLRLHAKTSGIKPLYAREFFSRLAHREKYYRQDIYDHIVVNEQGIYLSSALHTEIEPRKYTPLPNSHLANLDSHILIRPETRAYLPSLSPFETLREIKTEPEVPVFLDKQRNQHFLTLPKDAKETQQVKVKAIVEFVQLNRLPLLPELSSKAILGTEDNVFSDLLIAMNSNHQLELISSTTRNDFHFLSQPSGIFITELISFLNSFTYEPLSKEVEGIDLLNLMIQEKKGSPLHSAILFMTILSIIGQLCRIVTNDVHVYIEINIKGHWWGINLNTTLSNDYTLISPISAPPSLYMRLSEQKTESLSMQVDMPSTHQESDDFILNVLARVQPLSLHKKNALLLFNSEDAIHSFYVKIMRQIKTPTRKIFYLTHLADCERETLQIKDSSYKIIPSELTQFLATATAEDILIVNCNDYATEPLPIMTLTDETRRIGNQVIPPGVIVIALLDKSLANQVNFNLFYRFTPVILPVPNMIQDDLQKYIPITSGSSTQLTVKFKDPVHWEKYLIGSLLIDHSAFKTTPGAVMKALFDGRTGVHLINAPWNNPEFVTTLLCIKEQGFINYFGTPYPLPMNFSFTQATETYALQGQYSVITRTFQNSTDWDYPLNRDTYPLFMESWAVRNNQLVTTPGWLHTHPQEKPMTVLVNGTLQEAEWDQFLSSSGNINVCFMPATLDLLSPRLNKKEELKQCDNPNVVTADDHSLAPLCCDPLITVIETSDIYYTAEKLSYKNNTHVYVAETQGFNDVFDPILQEASLNRQEKSIDAKGGFYTVLNYLNLPGKYLILYGHFRDELIARASTLFSSEPYLWLNGGRYPINSKIIFVTDDITPFKGAPYIIHHQILPSNLWDHVERKNKPYGFSTETLKHHLNQTKYAKLPLSFSQLQAMARSLNCGFKESPVLSLQLLEKDTKDNLALLAKNEGDHAISNRLPKITQLLNVSQHVILLGPHDSGKTHFVLQKLTAYYKNELKEKCSVFTASAPLAIEDWANYRSDGKCILFFDNAHLEKESFERFNSLYLPEPHILGRNGKVLPLTPQHKIIFAANFMQREDPFFKLHGNIILFNTYPALYIQNQILFPLVKAVFPFSKDDPSEQKRLSAKLILASEFYKKFTQKSLSMRVLQSIILKTHFYKTIFSGKSIIMFALYEETKSHLTSLQQGQLAMELKLRLSTCISRAETYHKNIRSTFNSKRFTLTPNYHSLLNDLYLQLVIREQKLKKIPGFFAIATHGLFIEGPKGIGKKSFVFEYLHQQNFMQVKLNTPETEEIRAAKQAGMTYVHATPMSMQNLKVLFTEACRHRMIIVMDAVLNALPLEDILNPLLANLYFSRGEGNFFIIVIDSVEPHGARISLRPILANLLKPISLNNYSADELASILTTRGYSTEEAKVAIQNFQASDASLYNPGGNLLTHYPPRLPPAKTELPPPPPPPPATNKRTLEKMEENQDKDEHPKKKSRITPPEIPASSQHTSLRFFTPVKLTDEKSLMNWAKGEKIYTALQNQLGNSVELVKPETCSIFSPFDTEEEMAKKGAQYFTRMLIGFSVNNEFIRNGLLSKGFVKPVVAILNTTPVRVTSRTDALRVGGSHWVALVILPKEYKTLSGQEIKNPSEQVILVDSMNPARKFPPLLAKYLVEGCLISEKVQRSGTDATEVIRNEIVIPPLNHPEFVDLAKLNFQRQQFDTKACGWWAIQNAINIVNAGSAEVLCRPEPNVMQNKLT